MNDHELLRERVTAIIRDAGGDHENRAMIEIMDEIENEITKWLKINVDACTPLNDYHKGMCNGIEFVRCLIAGDEPKYL